MAKLDEIKEKLRKLIAKEESARELGNQAEAEAFASKIQQLLLEYELSMDDLKGKNRVTDINTERVDLTDLMGSHEGTWVYKLYSVGARYNFCKTIMPYAYSANYLTICGEEMHREFTHYFVNQLVSKIRELSRRSFKEYKGPDKRNTYIRAFLEGAVTGIHNRLYQDRETAKRDMPQVAGLVVNKEGAINAWYAQYSKAAGLGKARATSTSSNDGYVNGVRAGEGVSINKGVGSKSVSGTKLLN